MKRLIAVFVVLCVLVTALLWLGWPRLIEIARSVMERQVAAALGLPLRVANLELSLFPLRVTARGVIIGEPSPIAQVEALELNVRGLASLTDGRPVVELAVDGVEVDLLHLPPAKPAAPSMPETSTAMPSVRVERFNVGRVHMRFPMDKTVADLTVQGLTGSLETARLTSTVEGMVDVSNVQLTRKKRSVDIQRIHADGGYDADGLFLREATVDGDAIHALVKGATMPRRHVVTADFRPALLGVVVEELATIDGQAKAEGALTGDLLNPVFDGQLALQQGGIADHLIGDLSAHVYRENTILRFDHIEVRGERGGRVLGAVEIDIQREVPINSELQWEGVSIEALLHAIGVDVPFRARTNASTFLRGTLDPLDLDISGRGVLHPTPDSTQPEIGNWQASARVRPDDLLAQLRVSQAANEVESTFTLVGKQLGGAVSLKARDVSQLNALLPAPILALSLTGEADSKAQFSGTTDDPMLRGDFHFRRLTVMGTRVPEARGDFAIGEGGLTTTQTTIDTAAGRADVKGTLALDPETPNDWTLTLTDLNADFVLSVLRGFADVQLPVSGGTLTGMLRGQGRWPEAEVTGDVKGRWIRIGAEPLESINAKLRARLPEWAASLKVQHVADETVQIEASGRGGASLNVAILSAPFKLARWQQQGLKGTVSINGRLSGEPTRLDGFVEIAATELTLDERALGEIVLRADARRGDWEIRGDALKESLQLRATVSATTDAPYAATVSWNGTDFAPLLSPNPGLEALSSGVLELRGKLAAWQHPSGSLRMSQLRLGSQPYILDNAEPIEVLVQQGTFRIQSLTLQGTGSRLVVSGRWSLAGEVNVDIDGQGSLGLLELVDNRVESAVGNYAIRVGVRRAVGAPWSLSGQGTVSDATVDLGLPVSFTATNAEVEFVGTRMQLTRLEGKAGGGRFSLDGSIDVEAGLDLNWRVEEVAMTLPEWLEERISGSGRVHGQWNDITVAGDIEVLNALYDRNIELADLVPWFKQRLASPPARDSTRVVRLDIRVHAPGGLFVDNNYIKAELASNLHIGGTVQKPALTGTIEILGGDVTFRNRVFNLNGGSLAFRDPFRINPVINVDAETRISTSEGEYSVAVTVTGTAENPRVQLSSDDPSLTQNDIVALVAAGKTSVQMERESTGFSPTSILSILPTGAVEERVGGFIGVDTFEIGSERAQSTGTLVPEVTIGKNITDRLRATASSTLVETYQTVGLEYRLTRRISLLGSWQSQTKSQAGAVEGGAKVRYEFRRLPFSLWGGSSGPRTDRDAE